MNTLIASKNFTTFIELFKLNGFSDLKYITVVFINDEYGFSYKNKLSIANDPIYTIENMFYTFIRKYKKMYIIAILQSDDIIGHIEFLNKTCNIKTEEFSITIEDNVPVKIIGNFYMDELYNISTVEIDKYKKFSISDIEF